MIRIVIVPLLLLINGCREDTKKTGLLSFINSDTVKIIVDASCDFCQGSNEYSTKYNLQYSEIEDEDKLILKNIEVFYFNEKYCNYSSDVSSFYVTTENSEGKSAFHQALENACTLHQDSGTFLKLDDVNKIIEISKKY